jgi:hypothetical protein
MNRFLCLFLFSQVLAYADSLFERTVDHRTVSYLVLEDKKSGPWVTMLLVPAGQDAYKGQNYPVHIPANSFPDAANILRKIDSALLAGNQIYIKLLGSKVIDWRIIEPNSKSA